MDKKSVQTNNAFVLEEEKTLNWSEVQEAFEKSFGKEIYSSWLSNITLLKEYNDYLILGVPTRFFRDWIVSRYLDKILKQIKLFKLSLIRVEFKILEDNKGSISDNIKNNDSSSVLEIKDSVLNYNRLNPNLNFDNFIDIIDILLLVELILSNSNDYIDIINNDVNQDEIIDIYDIIYIVNLIL